MWIQVQVQTLFAKNLSPCKKVTALASLQIEQEFL